MAPKIGSKTNRYTGTIQPAVEERDSDGTLLYPYLPESDLVEAVNLAVELERPLLLKGEPGSGKTRLARAVAYELGLPFEAWHVKSTSRARDGFYLYDAVGRLRDAQIAAATQSVKERERNDNIETYLRWGPLGRAFRNEDQTVLLIDEIDKADIDFPNDLLLELDEQRFYVEETGQWVQSQKPPLVFITSNDEKDLPDAFLRRCVFFYISFPKEGHLVEILNAHFPDASERLVNQVIKRFLELRKDMETYRGEHGKKVSTSELLDWYAVLRKYPEGETIERLARGLPYPWVLLKSWEDVRRYPHQTYKDSNA